MGTPIESRIFFYPKDYYFVLYNPGSEEWVVRTAWMGNPGDLRHFSNYHNRFELYWLAWAEALKRNNALKNTDKLQQNQV